MEKESEMPTTPIDHVFMTPPGIGVFNPSAVPAKRYSLFDDESGAASKKPKASHTATHPKSCKCKAGCLSNRCVCMKTGNKCTRGCACTGCKNPFEAFEKFGVNIEAAKKDICLMQNLHRITDMHKILEGAEEELYCCDIKVPLSECCVGVYPCSECGYKYSYSWCRRELCEQACRPRNHCKICRNCGDWRDVHCRRCNDCYFAGGGGQFSCPCRGPIADDMSDHDL